MRTRVNVTLTLLILAAFLLQLVALPSMTGHLPITVAVLLFLGPLNNTLWALVHEAIHGNLHPAPSVNLWLGRALACCLGTSFSQVRIAHLLHHKHNRGIDRVERYDPRLNTRIAASANYFFGLFVGLYLSQLITPLLVLVTPMRWLRSLAQRQSEQTYNGVVARALLQRDEVVRAISLEAMAAWLLLLVAVFAYRSQLLALGVLLLTRSVYISFLDYVYHYDTPTNDVLHALNLKTSWWWSKAILNFNYHGVHHTKPSLPWQALPKAFAGSGFVYDKTYMSAALFQLKGPRTSPPDPI